MLFWNCFSDWYFDFPNSIYTFLFLLSVFLDMKTMAERLKNRYYCHKRLFISDMTRIFTNCRSYNKPDTEYYKCANTLEKFVMGKLRDAGLVEKWNISYTVHASCTILTNPSLLFILVIESRIVIFLKNQEYIL